MAVEGLVAAFGGFALLALIIGVTFWSKAKRPTAQQARASDQATNDNFDKLDR